MKKHIALLEDIQRTQPDYGALAFWWLGQHSFIVRTQKHTLYFDPYFSPMKERLFPTLIDADEVTNADFVFGSHDHTDHIDREFWPAVAQASPHARFVIPALFLQTLPQELGIPSERFIGVDQEMSWNDNDIKICGVPSAHEFLDPDPKTGLHPYMGFVVEVDGVRLYHSGDCCRYEGLETRLKAFGQIDVMMLPINGRDGYRYHHGIIGNMTYLEAADLAGSVRPRLVIPAHYELFEGNRSMEEAILFGEYTEAKYPELLFWVGPHGVRVDLPRVEG